MSLMEKLNRYVDLFNRDDEERPFGAIPNSESLEFLANRIPLIELPDEVIERTYYYRWWTFRKHFRQTPEGWIITEFLPNVYWAGAYNSINCACCFHLREGRWLRDPDNALSQYIDLWLTGSGSEMSYSMWLAAAVQEFSAIRGVFEPRWLDGLKKVFAKRIEVAKTESGLYYSNDDRDGMEYSVSGPGLRPTLNSYLYGDAMALAELCDRMGDPDAPRFRAFAEEHRARMLNLLWDGDFFRTIPESLMNQPMTSRPEVDPAHRVREMVGYIPWMFNIPAPGMDSAFDQLLAEDGFSAPFGLTTTERRHPRFMEEHNHHECLWNGPVWPFATTQTLLALANVLRRPNTTKLTKSDYTRLLHQYAASHKRMLADGRVIDWIDENMDPFTGEWLSRRILEQWGWREDKGGYERGKDYNHSMFCDLVLSGLLGIGPGKDDAPAVNPLIPDDWPYFRVENLSYRGSLWTIQFDRDGSRYGTPGLVIEKQ